MQVVKIAATIRMILVIDDAAPNPSLLKKELEQCHGVASASVDAYATEDILSVSLGPQKQKEGG